MNIAAEQLEDASDFKVSLASNEFLQICVEHVERKRDMSNTE